MDRLSKSLSFGSMVLVVVVCAGSAGGVAGGSRGGEVVTTGSAAGAGGCSVGVVGGACGVGGVSGVSCKLSITSLAPVSAGCCAQPIMAKTSSSANSLFIISLRGFLVF